ncbi:thioredoxin, mitochondrial [Daktulosphaira vitifoliae]|uniref:thioredoxin, mitochondrial n=1 Tax=Daktulosphaira vitifoliae TaxID=58002 RepID=UPI0021AA005D|nr:thioredoxin, mitochondrial [Daktulosphaira vitifoliae]
MSHNRFNYFKKVYRLAKRSISVDYSSRKSFVVNGSEDFIQNVLKSNIPVIVNFHAEWCEPCSTLTPMLNKFIGDSTSVNLAIVDVEKNADLVHTFEVKAVPAVLAIRNGHVIEKFIGLIDENMIKEMINKMSKTEEE